MKKLTFLCLSLVLLLGLCACGSQPRTGAGSPADSHTQAPDDPNLGRYTCTAVTMEGLELDPEGQWLELEPDGKALLFLVEEPDEAQWTLSGTSFTLTMGGETVATGTLSEGILTADLMGMSCTFVRDGTQLPQQTPPAEASPSTGTFTCQGLYTVTYPPDRFQAPGDGLTDLVSPTGTKVWFTKLDTRADASQWKTDFETKLAGEAILQQEQLELTAGEYDGQALIYQEADGWHAAVLVDFGRNRGSDGRSMAAACIYLSGPTREEVWNDDVEGMVSSLRLGQ